ncbi:MAG: hypothetical protein FWC96_09525 [Oscillospiraceae bacterium]|nr:hypothetical protein [Oscillospiraceae bacterium]
MKSSYLRVMVELGSNLPFPCPTESGAVPLDLSDLDMAQLPMFSADSRDLLTETIYVGKAVMKAQFCSAID